MRQHYAPTGSPLCGKRSRSSSTTPAGTTCHRCRNTDAWEQAYTLLDAFGITLDQETAQ